MAQAAQITVFQGRTKWRRIACPRFLPTSVPQRELSLNIFPHTRKITEKFQKRKFHMDQEVTCLWSLQIFFFSIWVKLWKSYHMIIFEYFSVHNATELCLSQWEHFIIIPQILPNQPDYCITTELQPPRSRLCVCFFWLSEQWQVLPDRVC